MERAPLMRASVGLIRLLGTTLILSTAVSAFTPPLSPTFTILQKTTSLFSTTSSTILATRDEVLSTARSIADSSSTGAFLSSNDTSEERDKLERLVAELEALVSGKPFGERERRATVGDWELVCTSTTLPSSLPKKRRRSKDTKKKSIFSLFPFLPKPAPLQKSLTITQRIRTTDDSSTTISRVDNVIEYTPPNTLQDLLPSSPLDLDLPNPFEITATKLALVHDAEVQSTTPVLRTKIGLKSVVLTVAGTSEKLEPSGTDVFGVNVPSIKPALESIGNAGVFDTTYVDGMLRISRGRNTGGNGSGVGLGVGETLRVFVRSGGGEQMFPMEEEEKAGKGADEAMSSTMGEGTSEDTVEDELGNTSPTPLSMPGGSSGYLSSLTRPNDVE